MTSSIRILALSACLAIPSLAAAQSVNEANASAVEARLLSFLGKDLADSGALAVKLAGDRYEVLFDLRKAFEKSIAPWTVKEANSILHSLRPLGDGLWEYAGQGNVRLATGLAAANRSSSVALNVGSFDNKGVFDEKLRFIRSGEFTADDVRLVMRSGQDSLTIAARDYAFRLAFTEEKPRLGDVSADVALREVSESFATFPNPEVRLGGKAVTGRFLFEDVDFNGIAKLVEFWSGSASGKTPETMTDAEAGRSLQDHCRAQALRWTGGGEYGCRWHVGDLGRQCGPDR